MQSDVASDVDGAPLDIASDIAFVQSDIASDVRGPDATSLAMSLQPERHRYPM